MHCHTAGYWANIDNEPAAIGGPPGTGADSISAGRDAGQEIAKFKRRSLCQPAASV